MLRNAAEQSRQAATRNVFQYQVGLRPCPAGVDLTKFVELNQMWVLKPGDSSRLLEKALSQAGVGPIFVAEQFDRDLAVEGRLQRLENYSHPTRTQNLN